ncbi:MAG: thiamine phosphate synthase [Thermoguttaceae bacterium]
MLLLGLLGEPECRAAVMLARAGVDTAKVQSRWPQLQRRSAATETTPLRWRFSQDVELALRLAPDRLAGLPRPVELATEHLLLGLCATDHEVSRWLREQGLDPDELESEIRKLYGSHAEPEKAAWVEWGDADAERQYGERLSDRPSATVAEPLGPRCGDLTAVLRIIDACGNRAREGLRVIEDYVRFVLDDRFLTQQCKQSRHDMAAAMSAFPPEHRLAARETQADVGTSLATFAERTRRQTTEVLAANLARLQESLRSLEEFAKLLETGDSSLLGSNPSEAFKQLRYRAYTLQRAIDLTRQGLERLASAWLCVLIDGRESPEAFQRLARSLVEAGVPMIQLRDKRLSNRELLERARLLRTTIDEQAAEPATRTVMVMNDRPDLAVLAGADGVHLGQDDLTVKDARRIVGPERLVGVSTHSIQQARQAVLDGASYLGVGPTFPSTTKKFADFPGVELLRAVADEIRLPAFAIGGVCLENLDVVLATGFGRTAVSGGVLLAKDPAAAAQQLLAAIRKNKQ